MRVQPSQLGPGVVAGSGMARSPSVQSPPSHHIRGVVALSPSQIGYQHPSRPPVAPSVSNGGRGTSLQSSSIPSSSGPYASSATHTPATPASPMKHQWSEGGYRASGGAVPLPYVIAELQSSPTTRTTGGRVPSQSYGSNPTRYNLPRCKMPHCDKPAIFDQHINEQREYCEEHINCAVSVGFARCCSVCQKMPARLDSEFCSESCSNLNVRRHSMAPPGTPGYNRQHTGEEMVSSTAHSPIHAPHTATAKQASTKLCENCRKKGKGPCSGDCAAAGNLKPRKQSDRTVVPEGLGQTCQECRGFIKEGHGRYCSKRCEEASRKPPTSRPQ
ncbi:hypothetical protein EDB92DRAFT_689270 [Lactarius akahatsu]|uniref:Uncharacterized protein n=1 Tax=Lactarius akahatsu TaxID=416441 RepID=A0AAD4LF75_9AGAM|nr:hypothetical protein EDB92DRAFT_689270 [Lactarius akahatsu]